MDVIDRRVIEIYIDVLSNETNFNCLFTELAKKDNIITSNLKKKYKELQENGATNHSLNRQLYKDIQTRGKTAFDDLIQCLTKIHPHLVELLSPSDSMAVSVYEEGETFNQNEPDCTEYQGFCTMKEDKEEVDESSAITQNELEITHAVKKLCHVIRAKFVSREECFTEANFHVAIKVGRKFEENDIKNIQLLYPNSNPKIIIINIISGKLNNSPRNCIKPDQESSDPYPSAVYIVNIHIHKGDHSASVINIIKEVVSHNQGYEIRDIFRVVMEKLAKWGCQLNSESRNFPKFYF